MSVPAPELRGGYFYPLNVSAALDPARCRGYIASCVRRALLEPSSARNAARRRSLAALERGERKRETSGTSAASRVARELAGMRARPGARAP